MCLKIFWNNVTVEVANEIAVTARNDPTVITISAIHTTDGSSVTIRSTSTSVAAAPDAAASANDNGIGGGAVAGIVIGLLVLLGLIAFVGWKKLQKAKKISPSDAVEGNATPVAMEDA